MRKEKGLDRTVGNLFKISIVINIIFFISLAMIIPQIEYEYSPLRITTVIGYPSNPTALDPIDTIDRDSRVVQHQVTQSLVEYDLSSNPQFQLKPVLAESWLWHSPIEISFNLRNNVYFHDGTRMTAEDVKWNFERLKWFCNASGTLPANATSSKASTSSLFYLANGTYIFKNFEANNSADPLNFTIYLNTPFAPLLDLLTFGATNILSPKSTPRWRYLDLQNEILIGTGPYKYLHFKRDREVRLERFDMFWGFPGYFEVAALRIIEDVSTRMTAAFAGQFDYAYGLPSFLLPLHCTPYLHEEEIGEDLCYYYLEIYCGPRDYNGDLIFTENYHHQRNNASFRRALALAINYTYIYEDIMNYFAVEGATAVARVVPGHNASIIQASDSNLNYSSNIEKARALMMSIYPTETFGLKVTVDGSVNDQAWRDLPPLRTLQINRHLGSNRNLYLNQLIENNFEMIGVSIIETVRDWYDYLEVQNSPWKMDGSYTGLCPDYLNPFNMLDPLFNPQSYENLSHLNVSVLNNLMDYAIAETNRALQLDAYENIQSMIYDVNRPLNNASHAHISLWSHLLKSLHKTTLKGVQYNAMLMFEINNWYWED